MTWLDAFPDRAWERPELVAWNREASRPPLVSFDSSSQAEEGRREASRWFLPLDGSWDFRLFDSPLRVPDAAVEAGPVDSSWGAIEVPGCWTRQGHDRPHYTNVQMPFREKPPHVPQENPTGVYRRSFDLPVGWSERRVVLHFGGAESLLYVFVNGRPIGLSKDSRLAAEFDITHQLVAGRNTIAAVVVRYCDGSFLEDQDHWFHGGLHREVFLRATPLVRIEDLRVHADYDAKTGAGPLKIEVAAAGTRARKGFQVEARLLAPTGRSIWRKPVEAELAARTGSIADPYLFQGVTAAIQVEVPGVRPWTAETPDLYRLVVTLRDPEGTPLEVVTTRLGFRRVEVVGRELQVNGQAIRIRGVNRHDHDPVTGKVQTPEDFRSDLLLMKEHHINALRTAHYPNDPRLLDACDELGLYVVDEANIEAHAYWAQLCRDPRWTAAFVDRGQRLVMRDRNHPSVLVWSLGNESGYGPNHSAMASWIRHSDPTRPLQYEGGHAFDLAAEVPDTDIVCPMYTPVEALVEFAKSDQATRPVILCEYSHAMGNSNGGLDRYFEAFEKVPGIQGGFVWDWKDQGLLEKDPAGRPHYVWGGAFGDEPNDATFCINGLVGPDRSPHPALQEFSHLAEPLVVTATSLAKGRFRLENRRAFTDLSDLRGTFEVRVDGRVVQKGPLPTLTAAPGKTQDFNLKLKRVEVRGDETAWLDLRFVARREAAWAPRGSERAWAQFVLPKAMLRPVAASKPPSQESKAVRCEVEEGGNLEVEGRGYVATFDPTSGSLCSLSVGGTALVTAGSRTQLWRAPTCNDHTRAVPVPGPSGAWKEWNLQHPEFAALPFGGIRQRGEEARFEFAHHTPHGLVHRQAWRVTSRSLFVEHHFEVPEELVDLPRLGIALGLDAGMHRLTWVGRGPHECYPDREAGGRLGRYEADIRESVMPYVVPQEFGLRTQTRWLSLRSEAGSGLSVFATTPIAFSATRYRPDDLAAAREGAPLVPREEVWLSLDARHRGVGTGACGPDVEPRFRVGPGTYRMRLRFEPVTGRRGRVPNRQG